MPPALTGFSSFAPHPDDESIAAGGLYPAHDCAGRCGARRCVTDATTNRGLSVF